MRSILLFTSILLAPGAAIAGAPLQCGLPPAALLRTAEADTAVVPSSASGSPAPSAERSTDMDAGIRAQTPPAQNPVAPADLQPSVIRSTPILQHIADSGARIEDLSTSHGLHTVLAREGDQFMMLEVAPDGAAAVAGLQSDLSAAQLLRLAGGQVTELGIAHGLRGLFVRNGQQYQVLYATPDGERLIPGVMWDATGKNVTRDQVQLISGAVPTVVLGKDVSDSVGGAAVAADPTSLLTAVKDTNFGTYGDPAAPRLWMFIDPQCPFSIRAMQELQPLVDAKKVQLAVIPLAVIDYENEGESTKSALAMLSKPPNEMVAAWRSGRLAGSPAEPTAAAALHTNMAAAEAVGLRGTPTFVWQKPDGKESRSDGLPPDLNALVASLRG